LHGFVVLNLIGNPCIAELSAKVDTRLGRCGEQLFFALNTFSLLRGEGWVEG